LPDPPNGLENDKRWILLTSDFRCSVEEILINVEWKGYFGVMIYPHEGSKRKFEVSKILEKRIKINVHFISQVGGLSLRKFTYPYVNDVM
jgi:hypothetical protein